MEDDFYIPAGNGGLLGEMDLWTPLDEAIYQHDFKKIREACKKYGFGRSRLYMFALTLPPIAIMCMGNGMRPDGNRDIFNKILDILVEEGYDLNTPIEVDRSRECMDSMIKNYFLKDKWLITTYVFCDGREVAWILLDALVKRGLPFDVREAIQILGSREAAEEQRLRFRKLRGIVA